jgi:hypothetical protein
MQIYLKYSLQNDVNLSILHFLVTGMTVSSQTDMLVLKFSVKEFLGRYVNMTRKTVLSMITLY